MNNNNISIISSNDLILIVNGYNKFCDDIRNVINIFDDNVMPLLSINKYDEYDNICVCLDSIRRLYHSIVISMSDCKYSKYYNNKLPLYTTNELQDKLQSIINNYRDIYNSFDLLISDMKKRGYDITRYEDAISSMRNTKLCLNNANNNFATEILALNKY